MEKINNITLSCWKNEFRVECASRVIGKHEFRTTVFFFLDVFSLLRRRSDGREIEKNTSSDRVGNNFGFIRRRKRFHSDETITTELFTKMFSAWSITISFDVQTYFFWREGTG